jgi:hypothetical protein
VLTDSRNRPGSGEIELPPHQCLAPSQADEFRENLAANLAAFVSGHSSLFTVSVADMSLLPPVKHPIGPEPKAAGLPEDFPAVRDPVTSSYTSLVRGAALGTDDRDVDGTPDILQIVENTELMDESMDSDDVSEPLPLGSDRGALFGTMIHAVLEECDFSLAGELSLDHWLADDGVDEFLSSLSRRYYAPNWYRGRAEALKKLVRSCLRSPIPGVGRLCDLPREARRAEVDFLIRVPRETRLDMDDIGDVGISKGFLKGFIDLLFETQGRWWVADWKTNVPPGVLSAASYCEAVLKETMDSHHYHLQYELYLLSLCSSLSASSGRAVHWDEEIGGAVYLFVRGMREKDDRGVFLAKPSKRRMLDLAESMGLTGVLE